MDKRIIFFDANQTVIPAIKYAKSRGIYVITCDNKKENPGHAEADEVLYESTFDTENVFKYTDANHVDGVVYFASGPGSYSGYRVIARYGLPGITDSIQEILSYKDNFRQYLQSHNFTSSPEFIAFSDAKIPSCINDFNFPVIVKPSDRGGNNGITKVTSLNKLQEAVNVAYEASRNGKVVIEEYIDGNLQINGDCIIENGEIKLTFLGRYLYPSPSSIIPCATIFGEGVIPQDIYESIKTEIQKLVSSIGIKTAAINVEFRVSSTGKIYFIEVNSRHSGNFIYAMMNKAYNLSLEEISVKIALNEPLNIDNIQPSGFFAYSLIYSEKEGEIDNIRISKEIEKYIFKKVFFKKSGDRVKPFALLSDRVGLCLLQFPTYEELIRVTTNFKDFYQISFKS